MALSLLATLLPMARAQVSFTGPDYTQDFNTLAASGGVKPWSNNTTLPGWFLYDRNAVALTTYNTNNANGAAFISFGAGSSSDRALGAVALQGGGAPIGEPAAYFAVSLTNNTDHTISTFNLNYTGEQWRVGTAVVANTTYLEYGFGPTYAAVSNWTRPTESNFHFSSPVPTNGGTALVLDGNAAANSAVNLGGDIRTAWASDATLWFRWVDINDAGNDHGLAIDNITIHEGSGDNGGGDDGGGDPGPLPGYVPFAVGQDSWSASDTPALQGANPELRTRGGANPKETVLQCNVTGVLGSVIAAKLRLYITASEADTKTQVYAAHNNWSEAALGWNTRPDRKTLLTEIDNPDPAGASTLNRYVDYDVTPYISGSGTYTFIITSTATVDIVYESREGANQPRLEVNYVTSSSAAEHNRLVTTVLALGEDYKARYADPTDINNIGIFDVTKQPYGADPTGTIDSTLAIQRAINEARDSRVVAYFPAGTYLVSDTLNMVQGRVDFQIPPSIGERWGIRDFACYLMGPHTGPRARLLLAPSAPGFNDPAHPRKLAYFWSRDDGNNADENKLASNYNHTLRDLDMDLNGANGNSGAIGADMAAAQGSSIYDLTIDATGASSGVHGTPGPGGSLTNVTILGGRFGIYARDYPGEFLGGKQGLSSLVANCTMLGQTEFSIAWNGNGTMTVVGTRIEGKGISLGGSSATAGNLSMVDSIIRLTAGGTVVSGTRSLHMDNVFVENADDVANLNNVAPLAGNPGGWLHVREYAGGVALRQSSSWDTYRANLMPPLSVHGVTVVPGFVNGERFETSVANVAVTTADQVPADLLSRHAWRATPGWNDTDVLNVKTWAGLQALGDNATDDLAALQAAIDSAVATGRKVFLPKGDYRLSAPLVLRDDTTLFGVNKNIAIIKPLIGAPAFADAGNPNPLVTTPDSVDATTAISEIKLLQRMNDTGVYLLQWRTGAGSQVKNVNFDRRNVGASGATMHFPLVRIEAGGGGKWINFWADTPANQGVGFRQLLVSGTSQPLAFYMFNTEADVDGIYNVEFLGVTNLSVFACKLEGYHNTSIHVADSRNVRFFGFSGNAHPDAGEDRFLIENSEDILFAMGSCQQAIPSAEFSVDPNLYNHLREVRSGEADTITPGWEQFTLYRRGQPGTTAPMAEVAVSAAELIAGTPVLFTATVTGPGPFTYQWFKGATPINGATSATLSIPSAVVADTGSYTVMVSNAFGSVTSTPAIITVNKAPATIVLEFLSQSYDGTPRVVTATTNPAGLAVILTYDGAATAPVAPGSYTVDALVDDPNYTGATSGTLIVTTTALVRHAPSLGGGLDGSIQVLLGENISLTGGAWVSGDLLVPGTPDVRVNGHPIFGGTLEGSGDAGPSDYQVTLNGNAILRHLVQRTDPLTLPTLSAPPAPAGARDVVIQSAGQSIGDPATLRNLTLNGHAGDYVVPAGTYGTFDAKGTSGYILGESGATTPAVYHLQNLTLNGNARLRVVGPVVLVLARGGSIDGSGTVTGDPEWLTLAVASGGLTLNGNASFIGSVVAPSGTVTINGNAKLTGRVNCDRLTINGNGLLEEATP